LVTAFAHDNVGLEMVTIYINDSAILAQQEPPFEFEWATMEYTEDAMHTIWAKASDEAGNTSQTQPIQVKVDNIDNISPTGAIIFPYTGQTLSGDVIIIMEAQDNDSLAYVNLYIDNDTVSTMTEAPYTYEWSTTELVDDITYTIYAHVMDGSGNQVTLGPISVLIDNYKEEDTISPTGTITNPPSASTVSGIVTITVSAYDNTEMSTVDFIIDGSAVFQDTDYPYEYDWNTEEALEDADHVINVNLTDWAGNTTSLFPISVFVNNEEEPDVTVPTIVLIEPAAGQTVSGAVDVIAMVTDDVGVNRVEFYKDYALDGTVSSDPYEYNWDTSQDEDHTDYIWYAKVFDTSENSAQTQPIAVTVNNSDNIAPYGSITYPYAGQIISGVVDIQVNATDNDSINTVTFYINGSEESSDNTPPFSTEWNTELFDDMEYVLTANISDFNNNTFLTQGITVTINNDSSEYADQIAPYVVILNPLSSQIVSDTVVVSVSATDNDEVSTIELYINGDLASSSDGSQLVFDWETYSLENESTHTLWAIATDPSGNEGESQLIYVIVNNVYEETIEDLSLTPSANMITLNWSSVLNATSYKIYRDSLFLAETENLFYEDELDGGTTICYQVSPINVVDIEGILSEQVCEIALLPAPETITYSVDTNTVDINWSAVTNASGYRISRDGSNIWTGTDMTYSDVGLDYESTFLYSISAYDTENNYGEPSQEESVTTHTQLLAPELNAEISGITASLSWTSVSTATSYRIYQDGVFHEEVTILADTVETISGVESCFKVRAVNEHGTLGPFSTIECVTGSFSAPELSLSVTGSTASLSWTSVESAESYRVYKDATFLVEQTSLTFDENIGTGTEVCFTVRAVNGYGTESTDSNESCGTGE